MEVIISVLYLTIITFLIIDLWRQPGDQLKKILWTLILLFAPFLQLALTLS
jgi:hypothetical protein